MKTQTLTVTTLSLAELQELLRIPMEVCGYKVRELRFAVGRKELIPVTSYDFSALPIGTMADLIKEAPPSQGVIRTYKLAAYLAMLTDETLYGDKALPKTDYFLDQDS